MNKKYTENKWREFQRPVGKQQKTNNICVRIPEGNNRLEFKKSLKEIMAENFQTLVKDINTS